MSLQLSIASEGEISSIRDNDGGQWKMVPNWCNQKRMSKHAKRRMSHHALTLNFPPDEETILLAHKSIDSISISQQPFRVRDEQHLTAIGGDGDCS